MLSCRNSVEWINCPLSHKDQCLYSDAAWLLQCWNICLMRNQRRLLQDNFNAFSVFPSISSIDVFVSHSLATHAVEQVSTLSSLHPSRRSTLTSQQLALSGRRKSIGVKRDGKEFWEAHTTYRRGVTPDSLRPYTVRLIGVILGEKRGSGLPQL